MDLKRFGYLFLLLTIIFKMVLTMVIDTQDMQVRCNNFYDCHPPPATPSTICSYCVNDATSYDAAFGKCVLPFPNLYATTASNEFKCEIISACDPKCVNSICSTSKRSHNQKWVVNLPPICLCNRGFHGRFCDMRVPGGVGLLNGINLRRQEYIPGQDTETIFHFYAHTHEVIQRSYVHIETKFNNGFSVSFSPARCGESIRCIASRLPEANEVVQRRYNIRLRMPFKRFNKADKSFLWFGDHIHGYTVDIRARAFTGNKLAVEETWHNVFVNYYEEDCTECIALITLNNCGESPEKAVMFRRLSTVRVTRSVQHLKDGQKISASVPKPQCADEAKHVWKLWIKFELLKGLNFRHVDLFPGENTESSFIIRAFDVDTIQRSYVHIQADISNGFYISFATSRCNNSCCSEATTTSLNRQLVAWMYDLQLRVPFKTFDKEDKSFLWLGDHIYGYTFEIYMKGFTRNELAKNRTLNFFVNYTGDYLQSLECIALIQLNNCGVSPEKAITYRRYSDIYVTRSVQHLEDGQRISTSVPKPGCAVHAKMTWKMWINFELLKGLNLRHPELFPGENADSELILRAFDVVTMQRSYVHIQADPSNGFYISFVSSRCNNSNCKETITLRLNQRRLAWSYDLQLRVPFKKFDKEDKSFLWLGDHIYGYMFEIHMKGFTRNELAKNRTLNFFLNYTGNYRQSLECIALIQLNNCGVSPEKAVPYRRYSDIYVTRSVQHLEDGQRISKSVPKPGCAVHAKTTWKIWIINKESNYTFEYLTQPIMENHTNKTLVLPPFSLEIGKYKVLHEVRHVGKRGTSLNYQYCYFKIRTVPLVALAYGGSERRIFKDYGLTLVSRSSDPNMPSTQQGHLKIRWSSSDAQHDSGVLKGNQVYTVGPAKLEYGAEYNFTLTVWTDKYDNCEGCDKVGAVYTNVIIKVALQNESKPDIIPTELRCIQNCDGLMVPNRILILRVKFNPYVMNTNYSWSYCKEGEAEQPTEAIEQKLDATSILIVDEDKLELGTKYTIVVRDLTTTWPARYSFTTDTLLYTGECTVVPDKGTKGIDLFNIECATSETEQYRYEFYDKTDDEAKSGDIFNGRMLGTTKTGFIQNVRLTRGHVMVYVYNDHGLSVTRNPSVSLTELVFDAAMKDRVINELEETIRMGDASAILGYVSFIPDVLPDDADKTEMANTLLDAFKSVGSSSDLGDVKQWTSTMANVLLSLNKPKPLALEPRVVGDLMDDINVRAEALSDNFLRGRDASKWMSPKEVKTLSRSVLNCVLAGVISKDDDYVGADEENTQLNTLEELRKGSEFAEKTLENLKDVMSFVQSPGQPPSKISSSEDKISLWAMEHDDAYSVRKMLAKDKEIPIEIPKALISDLEGRLRNHEELTFQVAVLEENLFWWDKSHIESTLTSVSLSRQTKGREMHKISRVPTPMTVTVRVTESSHKNLTSSGTVRLDPGADPDSLDTAVRVHRLDPEPRAVVSIQFHYPQTNASLRVLHSPTIRPDYEMMQHYAKIINETNSRFSYFYDSSESIYLYLGVLPGPDVAANQTVAYSFEVTTALCQLWARDAWTSEGCKISADTLTSDEQVHCKCQHFSIFAAVFPVPPEEIDPFGDARLFLTVLDNPLVVAFVSFLLVAFLLLILIMRCMDRRDERLKRVVVLDDNYPSDPHPYLLAVYTSSRFNAGCTAHVGIRVFGDQSNSRAHIFSAKDRKVLKRDMDDWFVIYCPQRLGDITSIHLWHDNYGSSPEWFVEKILVFDLVERTEYQFVVEQWLSLRQDCFPEANVLMAKARDLQSVKRIFLDNFILGLREGHVFISMAFRHPRSEISRVQRISVLMVCIMVAMLCSIMFYRPPGTDPGIDSSEFSVGMREVIISIQCVIISILITSIVLLLFRLSYKTVIRERGHRDTLMLRGGEEETRVYYPPELKRKSKGSVYIEEQGPRKDSMSMYRNFVRMVTKTMKTRLLVPVQGPHSSSVVKVRIFMYIIAWTVCLFVIVSCAYLVMLYGLKLGLADSKKWLSAVLLSMGEEIAVTGPFRLLVAALILSLAHRKMFEPTNHRLGASEVLELRPENTDDYFERLLVRRCHPMYTPLSADVKKTMLSSQQTRNNWWTLIDFVVGLVFVIVLNQLAFTIWSSHYHANKKIDRMITKPAPNPTNLTKLNLYEVHDINTFEKYLKETFVAMTYKLKWYDGETKLTSEELDGKYWANGNVNRMVGQPQIRQLRTTAKKCTNLVGVEGLCPQRWSYADMDDDIYGEAWKPATLDDMRMPNSPWRFSEKTSHSTVTIHRLFGKSCRVYDSGGYLTSITTSDREKAEGMFGKLETFNWQDYYTRAVFLEFTLYNGNTHIFSQVTLIVEYLISTETLTLSRVTTMEGKFRFNIWYLLFVIFIIYYCIRLSYLVNQQGLLDYLKIFNNKCRFAVVILGILAIVMALLHYYVSMHFIKEFQRKGKEEYFNFDIFYNYFRHLQTILSLLIAVAIVRMFMLIRLGRPLLSNFYTFIISWRSVAWLTIVAILLFFVLSSVAKLMQIVLPSGLKDIVVFKSAFNCELNAWNCLTLYFLGVKLITYSIVMGMYIIMFMYYVKIAKCYKLKPTDDFNFITLVSGKLRKCCNRK